MAPAALALSACATTAPPAAKPIGNPAGIESGTLSQPGEVAVPRDGDPAKLARLIEQLEQRANGAADPRALSALAEAHFVMAESIAVLGWKDQGEAPAHYAASTRAAEAALTAAAGDPVATYWLAASRCASAELEGFAAIVQTQASARAMLSEVARLAPQIDRGGAHRLLASFAAHPAHPSLRDLELARQHADAALQVDARAAANVIAFVEHYAVPAQNRAALEDKRKQLVEHSSATDDAVAALRAGQLAATIEDRLE